MRLRSVWNQNRNSAGRYWHKHNIFDMNFKKSKREPAIIWKRVNCQRITSKNTRPRWVDTWARDTVRWYWSADTLFWQLSIDDNINVQSAFSWAPKVARKCESKHWYACGADGRAAGGRCTVTWLPNFLGWVDLLTHGAPEARFARQSSAKTLYKLIYRGIFYHSFFLFACEQSFQTASFCLKFWFFFKSPTTKIDFVDFLQIQAAFWKTNYTTFSYLLLPIYGQEMSEI